MKLLMLEPRQGINGSPVLPRGKVCEVESEREAYILTTMGSAVIMPLHPGMPHKLTSKAFYHLLELAGYNTAEMYRDERKYGDV